METNSEAVKRGRIICNTFLVILIIIFPFAIIQLQFKGEEKALDINSAKIIELKRKMIEENDLIYETMTIIYGQLQDHKKSLHYGRQ